MPCVIQDLCSKICEYNSVRMYCRQQENRPNYFERSRYGHPAGVQFSCISRVSPVKPSACGRGRNLPPQMTYFYLTYIISRLFSFVKYFFIFYQPIPFLFINFHKSNNGILYPFIIRRGYKPHYSFKCLCTIIEAFKY